MTVHDEEKTLSSLKIIEDTKRPQANNLVIALVAALVVALGFGVWAFVDGRGAADDRNSAQAQVADYAARAQAEQDAIKAASAFVVDVTTYSAKAGEHDLAWIDQIQNEEVRKSFQEGKPALQKRIVDTNTNAKGQVLSAAARVIDPTQVEVLVVADQVIKEGEKPLGGEQPGMNITMKLIGGTWRVDNFQYLTTPLSGQDSQ